MRAGLCTLIPPYTLIFAHVERSIPPTLEQNDLLGVIELCGKYPSHTPDLARSVVETLAKKRAEIREHPLACLLPRHGVTAAGTDIDYAFDIVERIEGSCRILAHRAAIEMAENAAFTSRGVDNISEGEVHGRTG